MENESMEWRSFALCWIENPAGRRKSPASLGRAFDASNQKRSENYKSIVKLISESAHCSKEEAYCKADSGIVMVDGRC